MQPAFLFKKKGKTQQNLKKIIVIQVYRKLSILQKGIESALHKLANNNTEIFSGGKFFSFIFS